MFYPSCNSEKKMDSHFNVFPFSPPWFLLFSCCSVFCKAHLLSHLSPTTWTPTYTNAHIHSFIVSPTLSTEPTDGHLHGSLSSLPPEHSGGHPVSATDLDCWHSWHIGVYGYCRIVLLLCEYFFFLISHWAIMRWNS